jgi:hypothetical protein
MSAQLSEVRLAGADEAADLGGYLTRLLRFDKAAAVRVVVSGSAAGVYGRPPFDVLTLRTVAVETPSETEPAAGVDVTVSAGDLLHAIADDGSLALPRPLAGATAWTGFLPPRAGWQPVGELPVAEVQTAALAGIAEFKQRAEAIPDKERTRAAVDRIAAEIWDRPLTFGLPVRAAHAARAMAFLGQAHSATAVVRSAGRWLRLDAPFGTIVVRTGSGLLA